MFWMIPYEYKQLWKVLKVHKSKLVMIAGGSILMAGSDTYSTILIKKAFDAIQEAQPTVIASTFVLIILVSAVKNLSRYVSIFNMNVVSERVAQSYREMLQQKFMRLNLTFHNTFASGSGGLISRVMNDIKVIYDGLRMYADFFREPFVAIGMLGVLFYFNWKLTLIIFFVLPMVILFNRYISKFIKRHGVKGQEDLERITGTLKESLDGVRVIQSYNLESEMGNRFHDQSEEFIASRRSLHRWIESSGPITEFIMVFVLFSIFWYFGNEIVHKQATLGDFMGFAAAAMMMQAPVKKFQESYVRVQETLISLRRAYSLLDDKSEVPQENSAKNFPKDWSRIEYRNVSFRYGQDDVLKNLNLTIPRGEVIAFVGASGSGKSTLVNLLERFFDPTSGEILIDSTPICDIKLHDLRHNIALVTQDVFLFSDTIERNIWAGDFTKSKDRVESSAQSANASSFIQRTPLGFQNKVGDRGNLLSGGEKQRISIARAVFKDAPILILDEATSALDSKSEQEVQKGLDAAMEGRTALIIAHRLSTIARAHRICVMKAGEIVEMGTHQELLSKKGEYYHLHQLQSSNA